MYAFDRIAGHVFLYDPDVGLAIPMVILLEDETFRVTHPSVDDLHHNYDEFRSLPDLLEAIGTQAPLVVRMRAINREASIDLADLINHDDTTDDEIHDALMAYLSRRLGQTRQVTAGMMDGDLLTVESDDQDFQRARQEIAQQTASNI